MAFIGFFSSIQIQAQTIVKGSVKDAKTGEGIPFANVVFKGTNIGATTNFDGYYQLKTYDKVDSIEVSYIGYLNRTKAVLNGKNQIINFQLQKNSVELKTVDIVEGEWENPAWKYLRGIVKNKKKHDKRSLDSYEYESYTKIELDVDNISEKFKKRKVLKKIIAVFDSLEVIAGEDGKPLLPVFISESVSKVFVKNNPYKKRENIEKTNITGIAYEDGTFISQLAGSSLQEYNFYKNYLPIFGKDFVSPISNGWKVFYEYELLDEFMKINGRWVCKIRFQPKQAQDLAFKGLMWIDRETFALIRIDAEITSKTNINYIENLKIQQELSKTDSTFWIPSKTRVLIDVGEIKDNWAGMLAKFYISNKNFEINKKHNSDFYEEQVVLAKDFDQGDEKYWNENRHDTLSTAEKYVYHVIDTIRNLPVIKTYTDIAQIVVGGYYNFGKIEVGPYPKIIAFNDIEGIRLRAGMKTNYKWSEKWFIYTYLAYGTKDEKFKYSFQPKYLISKKPWTVIGAERTDDIEILGVYDTEANNNELFTTFLRFGNLRQPFNHQITSFWGQRDLLPGLSQKIELRNRRFQPLFNFEYFADGLETRKSNFEVSEIVLTTRLAFNEKYFNLDASRLSINNSFKPIITFRGIFGLKNVLGGDFSYQNYQLNVNHTFRAGLASTGNYQITLGYIPSTLPFPLLQVHLGNQSIVYNSTSFNMMNYFEFVSDAYASLRYQHNFNGLILNRIPLMKKIKARSFASADLVYGSLRQANKAIIPVQDQAGNFIPTFDTFENNKPYVEVGYGVENILKFIKLDFRHRLTYLNKVDVQKFAFFLSAKFDL